jgi:hypothetical protein
MENVEISKATMYTECDEFYRIVEPEQGVKLIIIPYFYTCMHICILKSVIHISTSIVSIFTAMERKHKFRFMFHFITSIFL